MKALLLSIALAVASSANAATFFKGPSCSVGDCPIEVGLMGSAAEFNPFAALFLEFDVTAMPPPGSLNLRVAINNSYSRPIAGPSFEGLHAKLDVSAYLAEAIAWGSPRTMVFSTRPLFDAGLMGEWSFTQPSPPPLQLGGIVPHAPEPETWALMMAGLAALGWRARRR